MGTGRREMDVDGCRYGCPDHLRIAWAWQAHGLGPDSGVIDVIVRCPPESLLFRLHVRTMRAIR
jgi:hypothetical protein